MTISKSALEARVVALEQRLDEMAEVKPAPKKEREWSFQHDGPRGHVGPSAKKEPQAKAPARRKASS